MTWHAASSALRGLEQVPRAETDYRDTVFTEMDVDAVLRRAPAVALVDELAHTNVPGSRYAKRGQDVEELRTATSTSRTRSRRSLSTYFRPGNLTGGPEGRTLIRRAVRLAEKGVGGEVLAVHISRSAGLTSASPKELADQRTLVEDLGGTFHHAVGDDMPAALLDFARGVNATRIVLGVSRRRGRQSLFGPGVGATLARESGPDLDVHLITHDEVGKGRGLPVPSAARLGRRRVVWGWLVASSDPPPSYPRPAAREQPSRRFLTIL